MDTLLSYPPRRAATISARYLLTVSFCPSPATRPAVGDPFPWSRAADTVDVMQATHWVANGHKGLRDFAFETTEVREPGTGQVTIEVAAAGVNPADLKHSMRKDAALPALIGYEVSGTITAIGPDTEIASGPVAVGQEVLAFRIYGGYATALTVRASDVYAKPDTLPHPQAANLLLAGTTASEMLHVTQAAEGDTILLHGASGAVGVMVLQLARRAGITVVGTASKANFEKVESFGGIPVEYGHGLERRVRTAAPDGSTQHSIPPESMRR